MVRLIRFAVLSFVLACFSVSTLAGQSYLHDKVNKQYGNLGVKDKLAAALHLEDSADKKIGSGRNTSLMSGERAEDDLKAAAVLYAQISRSSSAVVPDLVRTIKTLESIEVFHYELEALAESMLVEYGSGNKRIAPALEQIYQMYLKQTREGGFDIAARYRGVYMRRFFASPTLRDPFYCSSLLQDIERLAEISKALSAVSRIKLWELHLADALSTDHNCEGGWDYEYSKSYELYSRHGENLNARAAAEKEGDEHLKLYSAGVWFESEGKVVDPPGRDSEWNEFTSWYAKAALTPAKLRAKLSKAAEVAADNAADHRREGDSRNYRGSLNAAIRLYRHLGNTARADRLALELR